jgi:hypothetical protein
MKALLETTDDRFWHAWQWGNASHRYYGLDLDSERALERLARKWFYATMRRLEQRGAR